MLAGCDMIEYHPYDGRIKGEKNINAKNIEKIEEVCANKDTIRFAILSDTQRWYDETEDCVKNINKRNDLDFVIHGGDLSDFGLTREFEWQRNILNKLKVPYVALLGNHDCLANGEQVFTTIFGKANFSFIAGDVKFVCLNTNALEFDYSRPVPDLDFIEHERTADSTLFKRTVFAMHVPPFDKQFNNNLARHFQEDITRFPDLLFCIHGHTHRLEVNDFFDDGIIYYGCENISKRSYLVFTITPDKYEYEVVKF